MLTQSDTVVPVVTPSPSPTSQRRAAPLPPEERRTAIIHAALPLLIEHGAQVTSRQIAVAAGVSEGTIFNVFADKDELLLAALDVALDQAPLEEAISRIDPGVPFEPRLVAATELIQRRIVDVWRLVSRIDPARHDSARRRALPTSPALAELLAAEPDRLRIDPVDAARLLRSLTLSLTHPLLAPEPSAADEIVDLFLHGAGT